MAGPAAAAGAGEVMRTHVRKGKWLDSEMDEVWEIGQAYFSAPATTSSSSGGAGGGGGGTGTQADWDRLRLLMRSEAQHRSAAALRGKYQKMLRDEEREAYVRRQQEAADLLVRDPMSTSPLSAPSMTPDLSSSTSSLPLLLATPPGTGFESASFQPELPPTHGSPPPLVPIPTEAAKDADAWSYSEDAALLTALVSAPVQPVSSIPASAAGDGPAARSSLGWGKMREIAGRTYEIVEGGVPFGRSAEEVERRWADKWRKEGISRLAPALFVPAIEDMSRRLAQATLALEADLTAAANPSSQEAEPAHGPEAPPDSASSSAAGAAFGEGKTCGGPGGCGTDDEGEGGGPGLARTSRTAIAPARGKTLPLPTPPPSALDPAPVANAVLEKQPRELELADVLMTERLSLPVSSPPTSSTSSTSAFKPHLPCGVGLGINLSGGPVEKQVKFAASASPPRSVFDSTDSSAANELKLGSHSPHSPADAASTPPVVASSTSVSANPALCGGLHHVRQEQSQTLSKPCPLHASSRPFMPFSPLSPPPPPAPQSQPLRLKLTLQSIGAARLHPPAPAEPIPPPARSERAASLPHCACPAHLAAASTPFHPSSQLHPPVQQILSPARARDRQRRQELAAAAAAQPRPAQCPKPDAAESPPDDHDARTRYDNSSAVRRRRSDADVYYNPDALLFDRPAPALSPMLLDHDDRENGADIGARHQGGGDLPALDLDGAITAGVPLRDGPTALLEGGSEGMLHDASSLIADHLSFSTTAFH